MYAPKYRAAQAAVFATAATLSLIAAAVPVQASPVETVAIPVSHHDLDLASDSGVRELGLRVKRAANAACAVNRAHSLAEKSQAADCRDAALAGVHNKVAIAIAQQAAPRLASRSTAN